MYQARVSVFAGLCLICQIAGQPARAQGEAAVQVPVFLCQFGDAAHAYAFRQGAEGQWHGLGQLRDWSVTVQDDGLVARNADDVLILSEGSASLLQGGNLVRGQCVDPTTELAELFATGDFYPAADVGPCGDEAGRLPRLPDEPPTDDARIQMEIPDPWVADVMTILDPGNWDAAQVAAIIDALNLDNSAKLSLKSELKAAARDPARIPGLARQIRAAFGLEISAGTELRAKLRETRRDLAVVSAALEEQRRNAAETLALLAAAQAKARTAERASAQAAVQTAALRTALNAAIASEDRMRLTLAAAAAQLLESSEKLALANRRITKLGGVRVQP